MLCSFSVYLHNILKNHTAHACEGDTLVIECPSRTSVAVVSAFYGRRVPNQHLCPSANTTAEEDKECTSPVAIQVNKSTVRQMWNQVQNGILTHTEDDTHTHTHVLLAESGVRVPGSAVLSHPCFKSGIWAGPLSPHQQVPSSLLQVQTRYVPIVFYSSPLLHIHFYQARKFSLKMTVGLSDFCQQIWQNK